MRSHGVLGTLGWILLMAAGCGSDSDGGGPPASTGGAPVATGGSTTVGGSSITGGSPTTGGAKASGGTVGTGGSSTGGSPATGGTSGKSGVAGAVNSTGGSGAGASGAPSGGAGGAGIGGGGLGGAGKGGASGASGTSGTSGTAGAATGGSGGGATATEKFSFFVTSRAGMVRLSKSEKGFGGDLRYGEATGLEGADKICRELAEASMPGAGQKVWRAFLSTTTVNAVSRIGDGPWYDRRGRVIATSKANLLNERPMGADTAIIDDLPNEDGTPNRGADDPGCAGNDCPDNHDTLTGSKADGTWDGASTCDDWTSTTASGSPRVGHTWPANSGMNWIQAHSAGGCQAGINLVQGGAGTAAGSVGAMGGYGGIYCLAMTP